MKRFNHNPKPGDIITVDNGNQFTCCTREQLQKRYPLTKTECDIYGIAVVPGYGWEGWRGDGSNDAPGYNIATITPAPDTDTILTPQDPANTQDLPAESAQAIAEARQIMATGKLEANKVYAAAGTLKFKPKPGDTIITRDHAYVCCTPEYLLDHYDLELEGEFALYGYRPNVGRLGVSAIGWDAQGKSVAKSLDITRVIQAAGNKPKFKGVVPKQALLDQLASLDGDNIRIYINADKSISID